MKTVYIVLKLTCLNFIKGIVHIQILFFKKVRPLFLNLLTCSNIYNLTELVNLSSNNLTSQYGKNCSNFLYILCKA